MADLEPIFTTVIAVVGGGVGVTVLRYFNFFRKNKVEDRTTETERLEAENKRAGKRADDAESDSAKWFAELNKTRNLWHREQEYTALLRAVLFENRITPPERRD